MQLYYFLRRPFSGCRSYSVNVDNNEKLLRRQREQEREEREQVNRDAASLELRNQSLDEKFGGIKIDILKLKELQNYALENQWHLERRVDYNHGGSSVYLVFVKGPDGYTVLHDGDNVYYSLVKNTHETNKHNVSITKAIEPAINNDKDINYLKKLIKSPDGILKNQACREAFFKFYYEKYDDNVYVVLQFYISRVLQWKFDKTL